jgi:hypothetical protein
MEVDHGPSLNSCVSSDSEDEENDGVMQQTKDSMEEEQLNCIQDPEKEILGVEDNLSNPNGNSLEHQGGMYETNTRVGEYYFLLPLRIGNLYKVMIVLHIGR